MSKPRTLLPPKINPSIRVPKKLKFAVTDTEQHKLHLKVFIAYCRDTMEHNHQELVILNNLFNALITPKNIYSYINAGADKIYHGITHDCLHLYKQK